MKKIAIVLGIVLILFLLLALLAPFLIDLNAYKGAILSRIQPYVPREMDFQHVELTVLSGLGVELRGLRVADNPAFSKEDFLELEGLQVRLRLLPLLRKQIQVKRIILKRPVIRVERDGTGRFSFEDLTGNGKEGVSSTSGEVGQEPAVLEEAGDGPGLLAGFLVSELAIQEGRLLYRDEVLWPGRSPLVIDSLDVDVRDVAFDRPVSIRLAAGLMGGPGQNFEFSGTVGPLGEELRLEKTPFSFRTSLEGIPVEGVLRLLPSELPVRVPSGSVRVDLKGSGSLAGQIVSEAEVELQDLRLEAAGSEPVTSDRAAWKGTISEKIVLEYTAEKLLVEKLDVSLNGQALHAQGTVESLMTDPKWDLKVQSEGLQPARLAAILPIPAQALPDGFAWEGPMAVLLNSAGTREIFQVDGRLDMEGMEIRYQDMFQKPAGTKLSVGCRAEKKGDHITLNDLALSLHNLALNASGELVMAATPHFGFLVETNPVALEGWDVLCPFLAPYRPKGNFFLRSSLRGTTEDASVNLQVSSDRIGFETPSADGGGGPGASGPSFLESSNLKVQAKRKSTELTALAQAEIKRGEIFRVPFERCLSSLRYQAGGFEITGLELTAFQGEIQGAGRYDPQKRTWDFSPTVKGLSMGEALDRLTEYKNVFSGTFRGTLAASGSYGEEGGTAVNAKGSFRVSEGELKNFDLIGGVLDALYGVKGFDQRLRESRKEIREHEDTRFDWLEGTFTMGEDLLFLEGVQVHNVGTAKGTDSDVLLDGRIVLDTQALDLKGKVILSKRHSEELAGQSEIFRALYNAEQRVVLPMTIQGSAQKPVPFLDTEYVLGAISRYYTRQGVDRLRKQLGLPGEEQGKGGGGKPVEQLLKDLLRKQ